ncbi:MAG: phosphate acetyltransferase [Clostridia bacterium]|nr:phosphate acetyltransferase [Clostridia bacterium]
MGTLIARIKERAKENIKRIVLPEGQDIRVIEAASKVKAEGIAEVILIGNKKEIETVCEEKNIKLNGVMIIDPNNSEKTKEYSKKLYELRKEKGLTEEKANEIILENIYFATMMVKEGHADGLVCGAVYSTSDTLRPALQIVKTRPGTKCVSAFFIMEIPDSDYKSAYIFADSGLLEFPTEEERAEIAIESNESCKLLLEEEGKVAMLSYSTKGSANSDSIESVKKSLEIVREKRPDIKIDGELQLDAAIDKEIAKSKAGDSPVAGNANVLIFPDLNAGNIGYKLVQRFAKANAYGPITQGLAKPINDLSRGCTVEDIVGVVAITAVQATKQ